MSIQRTPHDWSKDALFAKAQRYSEEMLSHDHTDWQFGFWSALALEMLVRASVAHISPALLADGKDWNNVLFAVGREPNLKKFNPKSADINLLLGNVENVFADFTTEMLNFSVTHISKRNSELHSGALPFDDVGTSSWLPMYYAACACVLEQMDETLESLFGEDAAKEARDHIKALKDEAAKSVKQNINAHKTIWQEKDADERTELENQAKNSATKYFGHRVACPACNCSALLHGSPSGAPRKQVDEDGIMEKQSMLPASFECVACGLKITGYSKLVACGLGDTFVSTSYYDAIEYFGIDVAEVYREMMGEDQNEPF